VKEEAKAVEIEVPEEDLVVEVAVVAEGEEEVGPGGRGGPRGDDKEWMPLTKLGRLVKYGKIKSLEEIYTHSIPIKRG